MASMNPIQNVIPKLIYTGTYNYSMYPSDIIELKLYSAKGMKNRLDLLKQLIYATSARAGAHIRHKMFFFISQLPPFSSYCLTLFIELMSVMIII